MNGLYRTLLRIPLPRGIAPMPERPFDESNTTGRQADSDVIPSGEAVDWSYRASPIWEVGAGRDAYCFGVGVRY